MGAKRKFRACQAAPTTKLQTNKQSDKMKHHSEAKISTASRRAKSTVILRRAALRLLICISSAGLFIISDRPARVEGIDVAPTIDYSHNMRILKLPASTPVGSLIYRLRGSDGDGANSQPLMFAVSGHEARALLDVVPVARSWNEADVYLRSKADKSVYNFTLSVSDGNKTTQVESTILITSQLDDEQQVIGGYSASNSTASQQLPFLNTKHVFHVPENAKPNELVGSINVLESDKSDLPVRFELRGKGAERFAIQYVFGSAEKQSRGEIVLANMELDYEKQNLYTLRVLALNAWTDSRFDTRNVATLDIVITVGDVQDSPPVFSANMARFIRLPTDARAGQIVLRCEAEDGDFADQRPIQYALDASSPLVNFFDINKSSGEVSLTKSVAELLLHQATSQQLHSAPESLQLSVFASELPDPSSYDHLWPPMFARADFPLLFVDTHNEPPQFVGGWQKQEPSSGGASKQVKTLHGYLPEWTGSGQQLTVRWFTNSSHSPERQSTGLSSALDELSRSLGNRPAVLDLGLGSNGSFELSLEGADAELFHLEPSGFPISRQTTFTLSVADSANKSLFDHEHNNKWSHLFTVDLVARDFGQPERLSSRLRCLIELVDSNDNWPRFDTDLYSFSVYENAPIGYLLGQVHARDADHSPAGSRISYVSLTGADSHLFRLDPESGQVTLEAHLDRETRSSYIFLVEARDSSIDRGLSNFTQLLINVLDVNDNAPAFLQAHYDAVLLSDGSFYAPLQVRALDADEPGTANGQVAYEIIAGNSNELFSIDSVSGVIYSAASSKQPQYFPTSLTSPPAPPPPPLPAELPSTLREPILPHHRASTPAATSGGNQLDQAGKIRPMHEVEEAPARSSGRLQLASPSSSSLGRQPQQSQAEVRGRGQEAKLKLQQEMPRIDEEQLPALDMLMSLETSSLASSAVASSLAQPTLRAGAPATSRNQLGPLTTLVVRAHDFGIPLRSSTVTVNIFNQALLTRSVSLILNGTIEQLDTKREAIERAFGSLTGSRASIESLDSLSDSSSLSVARVRLAVPEHSLVDLTDLSALMGAIEYRHPAPGGQHLAPQTTQPELYHHGQISSAEPGAPPGGGGGGGGNTHLGNNIFSDIHSYAIDSNAALERRLLVYIIIVGVCILGLLIAWMIYYCCSRSERRGQKLISDGGQQQQQQPGATYLPSSAAANAANKTHAKMAATSTTTTNHLEPAAGGSAIANNLAKGRQQQLAPDNRSMTNLLTPMAANATRANNYSMYNGQVWFEPLDTKHANQTPFEHSNNSMMSRQHDQSIASGAEFGPGIVGRRASSAPSGGANSLDSALHSALAHGRGPTWAGAGRPRNAAGQFFPNTLGYTRNVASIAANEPDAYSRTSGGGGQRLALARRGRKVAPMQDADADTRKRSRIVQSKHGGHSNGSFVMDDDEDLEAGKHRGHHSRGLHQRRHQHRKQPSLDSTGSTVSAQEGAAGAYSTTAASEADEVSLEAPGGTTTSMPATEMSVELDSDQELLGFDSTGTPIIATHTRTKTIRPIVVDSEKLPPLGPPKLAGESLPKVQRRAADESRTSGRGSEAPPPPGGAAIAKENNQAVGSQSDGGAEKRSEITAADVGAAAKDARREEGNDSSNQKQQQEREQTEDEEEANGGAGNKCTEGDNKQPQASSSIQTNPLMSELSQRISSRKGSGSNDKDDADKKISEKPAGAIDSGQPSGGDGDGSGNDETDVPPVPSTSASNKRQLMLKQQQQGRTTMTKSLTRSQTLTSESADETRSNADTVSISSRARELASMKNGELLEKKSIFAITYSGLATEKLPLAD